jgi:hypothetical protein
MRFATTLFVVLLAATTARAERVVIPVPALTARHPGGAGCVVTAVAGIARAYGLRRDLGDAQLIDVLARAGGTTSAGTYAGGQQAMLRHLGLRFTTVQGFDSGWLNREIRAHRLVIGTGEQSVLLGYKRIGNTATHAILLHGTGNDEFRYLDALPSDDRWLSSRKLAAFIERATLDSGELMAVYPPGR